MRNSPPRRLGRGGGRGRFGRSPLPLGHGGLGSVESVILPRRVQSKLLRSAGAETASSEMMAIPGDAADLAGCCCYGGENGGYYVHAKVRWVMALMHRHVHGSRSVSSPPFGCVYSTILTASSLTLAPPSLSTAPVITGLRHAHFHERCIPEETITYNPSRKPWPADLLSCSTLTFLHCHSLRVGTCRSDRRTPERSHYGSFVVLACIDDIPQCRD